MKTINKAAEQHIEALHERISELRKENESLRELLERIERIEHRRLGEMQAALNKSPNLRKESPVLCEMSEYKKRMIAEGKANG